MAEEIGASKLVVGMLKSADIASNLTDAIKFVEDQSRMNAILTETNTEFSKTLFAAQDLSKIALKDGYSILKMALVDFSTHSQSLMVKQKSALLQSAAGFRMASNFQTLYNKAWAQNHFLDLFGNLIFDMPESFIKEKVKRFYNNMYRIGEMDVAFATRLYNKKKISEQKWKDSLANHGIPDWLMSLVLDDVDQKPAMGTALRMYQLLDIPDDALRWLMTENNITMPQVQTLWLRYFHANRLRDEMMSYLGHLKAAYLNGLISETQLAVELTTFKASKEETDKIVSDMSTELQRRLTMTEFETRTWLYRKGVYEPTGDPPTIENTFYDQLSLLGVNSAIVNATVRLEAAKKGIDWERD